MKYHSLTEVPAFGEEPEVQDGKGEPKVRDGLEDDLGCNQVDSCEDTSLRGREN